MTTVTVTITETRPDLTVAWYRTPSDVINYIQKYNDIRHRTVYGWTSSPDMLSRTFDVSYTSQADHDTFLNDPQVAEEQNNRTVYNASNNITLNVLIS